MGCLSTTLVCLVSTVQVALSVASIVIGAMFLDDSCLDGAPTVNIAEWLLINGVSTLALFLLFFLFLVCVANGLGGFACLGTVLLLLVSMFGFAWAIVGAVRLSDADECRHHAEPLYYVTLTALCMALANLVVSCTRCVCGKSDNYETL
jgi:hypothetical protein